MARKIRIEYAGATYHVMARGNQGRDIYADERDRKLWLATLGEACKKTGWRIHAWVMMNNHYHLLLETPGANLVARMKWLQGTCTHGKGGVGVVVVPAHNVATVRRCNMPAYYERRRERRPFRIRGRQEPGRTGVALA